MADEKLPVDPHLASSSDPREASWIVPPNTKTVYAEIYDEKGTFVDRYTISTYITFKPGYRLRVIGR